MAAVARGWDTGRCAVGGRRTAGARRLSCAQSTAGFGSAGAPLDFLAGTLDFLASALGLLARGGRQLGTAFLSELGEFGGAVAGDVDELGAALVRDVGELHAAVPRELCQLRATFASQFGEFCAA